MLIFSDHWAHNQNSNIPKVRSDAVGVGCLPALPPLLRERATSDTICEHSSEETDFSSGQNGFILIRYRYETI